VTPECREDIEFVEQDIRRTMPADHFHLILCRNLLLTYFHEVLQRLILERMTARLLPGGAIVFGLTESVPAGLSELEPWSAPLRVYRRRAETGRAGT
jgi:chemotaxis protein methyltransferase CheR